jgi:hypothetical protein
MAIGVKKCSVPFLDVYCAAVDMHCSSFDVVDDGTICKNHVPFSELHLATTSASDSKDSFYHMFP